MRGETGSGHLIPQVAHRSPRPALLGSRNITDNRRMHRSRGRLTSADEAEAAIVATVVVPVAEDTKRAMVADQATDLLIKVATADPIQAVQQPVRIRIEAAAGQLLAENPGIKNKPVSREGRRRGFSLLR